MGASFFSFFRCALQCFANASISLMASLISCLGEVVTKLEDKAPGSAFPYHPNSSIKRPAK
jgi:hypothetical protein